MKFVIAGLGNPGSEYEHTRHNVGRMVVEVCARTHGVTGWKHDAVTRSERASSEVGAHTVQFVLPGTFMNRSGSALQPYISSEKALERLVVVHDDLDLPFGTLRIVFDRGAGGHRGVASIDRAFRSSAYVRVRVGVSPATPKGTLRKPKGEQAVLDFILGTFTKKEQEALPEILARAASAIDTLVLQGRAQAMNEYNSVSAPALSRKKRVVAPVKRASKKSVRRT